MELGAFLQKPKRDVWLSVWVIKEKVLNSFLRAEKTHQRALEEKRKRESKLFQKEPPGCLGKEEEKEVKGPIGRC